MILYTIEETSTLLSMSVQLVRSRVKSGEIKATKIGNTYRLRQSDIRAWLEVQYG